MGRFDLSYKEICIVHCSLSDYYEKILKEIKETNNLTIKHEWEKEQQVTEVLLTLFRQAKEQDI